MSMIFNDREDRELGAFYVGPIGKGFFTILAWTAGAAGIIRAIIAVLGVR